MNNNPSKYSLFLTRVFCVFISLIIRSHAFSQGEANNWYFGQNVGITFNGNQVSAVTDGKLRTYEGCASISDKKGRLLFYSDGIKVWDSTHNRTPNGSALNGNTSSTQSAVIVPFPDDINKYYIFTVENEGGGNGLQYSIFDMTLNNGKGDIVSGKKNIKLLGATCEKIAVVKRPNGKDYWILTHLFNSDIIYAFSLTSAGINTNPVKSNTGFTIQGQNYHAIGYMKSSPDGTKIAYANYLMDSCCIGDFNKNTGEVSNIWKFYVDDAYGLEFSSSGEYLYVSERFGIAIHQFDTWAKSETDFLSSKKNFFKSTWNLGALQLGPDKKIYIASESSKYLDVINAPDSSGKSCRITYNTIDLNGKMCWQGLPSFVQSFFGPYIVSSNNCYLDTSWFTLSETTQIDSVYWNFGDTKSKNSNLAVGLKVFHLYSDTGKYTIQTMIYKRKSIDTLYMDVLQKNTILDLGRDTVLCENQKILVGDFKSEFDKYQWNTKSSDPKLMIESAGIYSLVAQDKYGCNKSDTIKVDIIIIPKVNLGKDTIVCGLSSELLLDAKNNLSSNNYLWSSGKTSQSDTAKVNGKYWVKVSNQCGAASDSIEIQFLSKPKIYFEFQDVCEKDSVRFKNKSTLISNLNYRWKFGDGHNSVSTSPFHLYNINGVSQTFNVTLVGQTSSKGCIDSIVLPVTVNANPKSDFSYTVTKNTVDFKSTQSGNTSYKWHFGNGDSSSTKDISYTYPKSGKYTACLYVTNAAACFSKTCKEVAVTVGVYSVSKPYGFKLYPNPNTGNFTIEIENPAKDVSIEVYDVLGNLIKAIETSENKVSYSVDLSLAQGIYLVKVKNGQLVWHQKVLINRY